MVTMTRPAKRRVRVPVARPQDHLRPGGLHPGDLPEPAYEVVDYDAYWQDEAQFFTYATTATTTPTIRNGNTYWRWEPTTTATTMTFTTPTVTTAAGTTAYNPQVWMYWNGSVAAVTEQMRRTAEEQVAAMAERTPEQIAEQEEALRRQRDADQWAREERSRIRLEAQERQRGAQERALALFLGLLTEEERTSYEANDHRLVQVRGEGGTLFAITLDSVHGNVVEYDEHGCRLGTVCVAPGMYDHAADAYLPLADGWVGQLLSIRHDLENFRRRGNWSSRRACQQGQQQGPQVPLMRDMVAA